MAWGGPWLFTGFLEPMLRRRNKRGKLFEDNIVYLQQFRCFFWGLFWTICRHILQLYTTSHAPWGLFYVVPMLIGW